VRLRKIKGGYIKKFEDYLNIYKERIACICDSLCIQANNPKIEFEDLFQKSQIFLWRIFEKKIVINPKENFDRYILKSIKLGLVNYIERQLKKPLMTAVSIDMSLEQQEENFI